ncbi:hypothetical protein DFP72DRAFT_1120604 [Ephemerocybe angulata]|uniref:Uncharacterized protein n=1 Tax=Ephemerocybe angulata TaxID=980116 RepID=A0A8H6IG04_9AGAR|nr:hypothetical protein DFP72DRAFT_1120604 [Tulosesus angulatus]
MTEYDYSPQAWERYIATQQRIARWVDGTMVQGPCDAFTPATPHVKALQLKKEEKQRRKEERKAYYEDESELSDDHDSRYARSSNTRHRKSHSTKEVSSHRSPRKERSRERERDRRDKDRPRDYEKSSTRHPRSEKTEKPRHREESDYVFVDRDSSPSSSTRPRSSSQSVSSKPRPSHSSRSHTVPHLSLDLPAFPSRPQDPYYYHNRNSGHSSQSSATTPNSGSTTHGKFPAGQTMPQYAYAGVDKNGYPVHRAVGPQPVHLPIRPSMPGSKSYGNAMTYAPDPSKAPQYPYSSYQSPSKSQSLLKRMFGFKAKNEPIPQPQYQTPQPRDWQGSQHVPRGWRQWQAGDSEKER